MRGRRMAGGTVGAAPSSLTATIYHARTQRPQRWAEGLFDYSTLERAAKEQQQQQSRAERVVKRRCVGCVGSCHAVVVRAARCRSSVGAGMGAPSLTEVEIAWAFAAWAAITINARTNLVAASPVLAPS